MLRVLRSLTAPSRPECLVIERRLGDDSGRLRHLSVILSRRHTAGYYFSSKMEVVKKALSLFSCKEP